MKKMLFPCTNNIPFSVLQLKEIPPRPPEILTLIRKEVFLASPQKIGTNFKIIILYKAAGIQKTENAA
jgi:hypothetical protein